MKCSFNKYTSDEDIVRCGLSPVDIYQTYPYALHEATRNGGRPCFFLFESNDLIAALLLTLNSIPDQSMQEDLFYDASSTYGYPGFLFNRQPTEKEIADLFNAILPVAAKENIVSIFIRLHPYYNQFQLPEHAQFKQIIHGKTVYADLRERYSNIAQNYSSSHRRGIKTLEAKGFSSQINNWDDYPLFQEAYQETMSRVNAGRFYFFDDHYFHELKRILPEHLCFITVYDREKKFASGALYLTYGRIVQYHLGSTFNSYMKLAPSKLVFDTAIQYFEEQGFDILHFGGGVGSADDSLFNFKRGFSQHLLNFSTIRCIIMREEYDRLVKKHLKQSEAVDINYFPLYRQILK